MTEIDQIKVAFVNGPFLPMFSRESRSPAVTKSGTLYYPAWLAYACGYAEKNGHSATLIDCVADRLDYQSSIARVLEANPDLVVLGTSTPSIAADIEFAKSLKEKMPNMMVGLVGTHASATADQIITDNSHIDFVARREYDRTISEVISKIKSKEDWTVVKGLTFLKDGQVKNNPMMPYIHDLDEIPFASQTYKKHLNIRNYYYGHVRYPMISIFTSRGCDARCSFCLYPQTMFGNFRERSPLNIAQEFAWIRQNLPEVKEVLIDDDTFTMNAEHARRVSQELININNKIPWTCEARATLDLHTLKLMKKAGCRLIVTGFESVSQVVLNKINKNVKMPEVQMFVDSASKAGLKIHACFMAGNPGDTLDTLEETLNWALNQKAFDTAQFFPLQVYPGTKAYDWAVDANIIKKQDWSDWVTPSGQHNMTLETNDTGLTAMECLDFCDRARREFYLRPRYVLRQVLRGLLSPQEFKKNFKGFISLSKHLFKNVSKEVGHKNA